jgi:glyoxylase-like metal-dependent hydrolase (beta-lactamase superfamily II)
MKNKMKTEKKTEKKNRPGSSFILEQIEVGEMQNFAYIICDESTKKCVLIDPGWDAQKLISRVAKIGTLDKILLTHSHYDHAQAAAAISKETGCVVMIHKKAPQEATRGILKCERFADDEEIELGNTKIKAIHTPGHTIESTCFLVQDCLFTGDTLFVNACGRTDLPTGDAVVLFHSLNGIIKKLTDDTKVYPGHDYGDVPVSSIAREKKNNPAMRCKKVEEFLELFG